MVNYLKENNNPSLIMNDKQGYERTKKAYY